MFSIPAKMSARAAYNQISELKKLEKKVKKTKVKHNIMHNHKIENDSQMELPKSEKSKSKSPKTKKRKSLSINHTDENNSNNGCELDVSINGNPKAKKHKSMSNGDHKNELDLQIEAPKKLKHKPTTALESEEPESLTETVVKEKKSKKTVDCNGEINEKGGKKVSGNLKKEKKLLKKTNLKKNSKARKIITKRPKLFVHFSPFNKNGSKCKKKEFKGVKSAEDSKKMGKQTFGWMISPITNGEFFGKYWEQRPLLIKGEDEAKFKDIFSTFAIDKMLREHNLTFTKNIDLTSYKNGKRETHNPEGRALAPVVWDYYNEGCSIRLLNPQTFNKSVWRLLSTLQEYFNSFCGANVYLTPPGTQGFAPHWDDIEAFILQLEGKKRWRVYNPRVCDEVLPRESSGNFGPKDQLGEPVIDCILETGDLLYLPRGFIHQGVTVNDAHSLHITVSTFQKNSYADYLEKLLPAALAKAAAEDLSFRKGLPRDYSEFSGITHSDRSSSEKASNFAKHIRELVNKMMDYAPIDAASDQMAKGFIHDSLPPFLCKEEESCSAFRGGERWCSKRKAVTNVTELEPDTPVRILRRGCVRLVVEENSVRLYHSLENSLEYHAEDPKFIEIEAEIAPGMEALINKYPRYMAIESIPLDNLEAKMSLAMGLWEKGLLTTFEPLVETYDED